MTTFGWCSPEAIIMRERDGRQVTYLIEVFSIYLFTVISFASLYFVFRILNYLESPWIIRGNVILRRIIVWYVIWLPANAFGPLGLIVSSKCSSRAVHQLSNVMLLLCTVFCYIVKIFILYSQSNFAILTHISVDPNRMMCLWFHHISRHKWMYIFFSNVQVQVFEVQFVCKIFFLSEYLSWKQ